MIVFILLGVIILILLFYINFLQPMNYWKIRRVFHENAAKHFFSVFFSKKSYFEITIERYKKYRNRRYVGSYTFLQPALFVRDLDLIKKITVKDFDHFTDHYSLFKLDSVLSQNLFELEGETWKAMRNTLSPAFTSAKMKGMYTFIREIAENFANHFSEMPEDVQELDVKNIFSKFTNDVIATSAFGIRCDSLKDEKNEFFSMGNKIVKPPKIFFIKMLLMTLYPNIYKTFRISLSSEYVINFFKKLVKENMESRERLNIIRPDMIHLLMQAKKDLLKHENEKPEYDAGYAVGEEYPVGKFSKRIQLTDDLITAQALFFFVAGFDTTATMLSLLSHELAVNKDIQKKLQIEVDEVMLKCNNKVTYEELLKMRYLDQVVSELLRRYPPGYVMTRRCVRDYTFESVTTNENTFVLKKGTLISIPVGGIHMDPLYFPDPDKFNPERFSEKNKERIVPGSYMPFGNGPRNCIGSRFALLEMKALAVYLLSKFDIVPTEKTRDPIKFTKRIHFATKNGFWLALKKRKVG